MKKIQVTCSSMPPIEEYINEIKDLWDSHWLTNMGVKHNSFQAELKKYLGVENVELLTNGHMALELSMQAAELTGEVITTPFTFASTTHAIVRNGLTPVFCDIDPDDFTIDVNKIEALITEKTSAIVPVHVYGNVCDVEEIDRIAKKYNLKVIYDAAHCFGVKYKNVGIGNFGDASCFSFHATKVFNSVEGGAVCFKNADFGQALYFLKNFGITGPETVDGIGANAKMNEFCAAMGLCNLRHINEEIAKRKKVYERYIQNLKGVKGFRLNYVKADTEPNYSYFPIVVDEEVFGACRDEIYEKLRENNIFSRKYFYPLTNAFGCFKNRFDPSLTPIALEISKRVLTLPMYADLSINDVDRICEYILSLPESIRSGTEVIL